MPRVLVTRSETQERGMSKRSCTPLTQAARELGSHPAALRKAINRLGIIERDGRQRVVPDDILALFRRTKAVSGYLYPAWVRTHDDLIAAAAENPASEIESCLRADVVILPDNDQPGRDHAKTYGVRKPVEEPAQPPRRRGRPRKTPLTPEATA
jgi:hypothetical protein